MHTLSVWSIYWQYFSIHSFVNIYTTTNMNNRKKVGIKFQQS